MPKDCSCGRRGRKKTRERREKYVRIDKYEKLMERVRKLENSEKQRDNSGKYKEVMERVTKSEKNIHSNKKNLVQLATFYKDKILEFKSLVIEDFERQAGQAGKQEKEVSKLVMELAEMKKDILNIQDFERALALKLMSMV